MALETEIKLDFPVVVDSVEYSSLNMRRSKVKDRLLAQKAKADPADREIYLFGLLCGVGESVIQELDDADYAKLQDTYQGFLSGPLKA